MMTHHRIRVFDRFVEIAIVRIAKMFMRWKSFSTRYTVQRQRSSIYMLCGTPILRNPRLMAYSRRILYSPSNVITNGLYPTTVRMVIRSYYIRTLLLFLSDPKRIFFRVRQNKGRGTGGNRIEKPRGLAPLTSYNNIIYVYTIYAL